MEENGRRGREGEGIGREEEEREMGREEQEARKGAWQGERKIILAIQERVARREEGEERGR